MNPDPHLEDNILKPTHKKNFTGLIIVAVVIIVFGTIALYIRNAGVSADTLTPPTPPDVASITPPSPDDPNIITPPIPEDPSIPGHFKFPAGWSMVNARAFLTFSLAKLESAGISLYSYNDPSYPTTDWTIFPGTVEGKSISLSYRTPLGYYAYNPTTQPIEVQLDKKTSTTQPGEPVLGRGWHLLYWNGEIQNKDQLLSRIKINYADKTVLTGTQAIAQDKHAASIKIYVVVNQNKTDQASSIKELTGVDSNTTISKIPKNSYYWLYFRRTSQRVNSLTYGAATDTVTASPNASATSTAEENLPPVPSIPTQTAQ